MSKRDRGARQRQRLPERDERRAGHPRSKLLKCEVSKQKRGGADNLPRNVQRPHQPNVILNNKYSLTH